MPIQPIGPSFMAGVEGSVSGVGSEERKKIWELGVEAREEMQFGLVVSGWDGEK